MSRFIEGSDRRQRLLLPDYINDYVAEGSPVRGGRYVRRRTDLGEPGCEGVAVTGRPGYHPATMLKLYVYGHLNEAQSSRRLERESGRNVELMWLTGKLAPDFKTIADFRRERRRHPSGLPALRPRLPQPRSYRRRHGGGGRQPLARDERARQELHASDDPAPDEAGGRPY